MHGQTTLKSVVKVQPPSLESLILVQVDAEVNEGGWGGGGEGLCEAILKTVLFSIPIQPKKKSRTPRGKTKNTTIV